MRLVWHKSIHVDVNQSSKMWELAFVNHHHIC